MKKQNACKSILSNVLHQPIHIALLFLIIFTLLSTGFYLMRGTPTEHFVVNQLTISPSTWLINMINSQVVAYQQGHLILSNKVELSVQNGCEGLDVIFLMIAAILAYPMTLKNKLTGILTGIILMYILNQARIVLLFFALQNNSKIFDLLHGIISPIVIITIGCIFFYLFTRYANKTNI